MNNPMVNINMTEMANAVQAFVRSRAIKSGSSIVYKEKGIIIKEDPRTGHKTTISSSKLK